MAKFIIASGKIYWGDTSEFHRDIATRNNIPFDAITGGGMGSPYAKRLDSTNSFQFGPYNREELQKLLSGWRIAEPKPWKQYEGG